MKKQELDQIAGLISKAIERKETFIERCKGNSNPQVVEMRLRTEGELSALEDVELALRGNLVQLRILARGTI